MRMVLPHFCGISPKTANPSLVMKKMCQIKPTGRMLSPPDHYSKLSRLSQTRKVWGTVSLEEVKDMMNKCTVVSWVDTGAEKGHMLGSATVCSLVIIISNVPVLVA